MGSGPWEGGGGSDGGGGPRGCINLAFLESARRQNSETALNSQQPLSAAQRITLDLLGEAARACAAATLSPSTICGKLGGRALVGWAGGLKGGWEDPGLLRVAEGCRWYQQHEAIITCVSHRTSSGTFSTNSLQLPDLGRGTLFGKSVEGGRVPGPGTCFLRPKCGCRCTFRGRGVHTSSPNALSSAAGFHTVYSEVS